MKVNEQRAAALPLPAAAAAADYAAAKAKGGGGGAGGKEGAEEEEVNVHHQTHLGQSRILGEPDLLLVEAPQRTHAKLPPAHSRNVPE